MKGGVEESDKVVASCPGCGIRLGLGLGLGLGVRVRIRVGVRVRVRVRVRGSVRKTQGFGGPKG